MTEQEVAQLAARLTRIWCPEEFYWSFYEWVIQGEVCPGIAYESQLDVNRNIRLRAHISLPSPYFEITLFVSSPTGLLQECGGLCVWMGEDVEFEQDIDPSTEAAQQLLELYIPHFRRNCWLSGVPIEATHHEKAEWTLGFSREEVEAWKLKF